ncbi:MAG TPA: P-loop NTPase fold protein [Methylophilaceae bacterium]|jgi:hypothetical protein
MAYRLPPLAVPEDNPYKHDVLNRRPLVEFLAQLIERTGGPFVTALDSPWGSGKTTLVNMLRVELMKQNFNCIYFNAWQVDYVTDPLVALVSSIDALKFSKSAAQTSFRKHLKTVRRVTSLIAKRAAIGGAKALTAGVLDLDAELKDITEELVGDSVNDIVEAFQKEINLLEKFRVELEAAIGQLPKLGKKPILVYFVDELDRCRPTFAIELLERIKHLFDVPNIHFVLSVDKQQLEASIAAVYGQDINATEYLRRFIDLEYGVPIVKTTQFVTSLFLRFELEEIFAKRTLSELRYDRSNFIDFFTTLAEVVSLSLRAQERCLTRLKIVMDQTPDNYYLEPVLVALLIVLRSNNPELFTRLFNGHASAKDVMSYLSTLKGGQKLVADRSGISIESYLIMADEDNERKLKTLADLNAIANDQKQPEEVRSRASAVLSMTQHLNRPLSNIQTISFAARKIDLAAGLKD